MGKQYGQDWSSRDLLHCSLYKKKFKVILTLIEKYMYTSMFIYMYLNVCMYVQYAYVRDVRSTG